MELFQPSFPNAYLFYVQLLSHVTAHVLLTRKPMHLNFNYLDVVIQHPVVVGNKSLFFGFVYRVTMQ
jgi:hypothetical protein